MTKSSKPQGEGNKEAAKNYNRNTQEFVKSGKVKDAAKQAGKGDQQAMREAEQKGRERAREYDPNVDRDYKKATK